MEGWRDGGLFEKKISQPRKKFIFIYISDIHSNPPVHLSFLFFIFLIKGVYYPYNTQSNSNSLNFVFQYHIGAVYQNPPDSIPISYLYLIL